MKLTQNLEKSFAINANRPALEVDNHTITYQQLSGLSHNLASFLADSAVEAKNSTIVRGGGANSRLIVFGYREAEAYLSILACVFANLTFIPLNPKFPKERLINIISRVEGAPILLCPHCTQSFRTIAPDLPNTRIFWLDFLDSSAQEFESLMQDFPHLEFIKIPKDSLQKPYQGLTIQNQSLESKTPAYLLFTSGSTGIPKGVLVSRANLLSYCLRIQALYAFKPTDRISQFFDLTFDLSLHDIFCTLFAGATLVVIPPRALLNPMPFLAQANLSVFFAVPSLIAYLQKLKSLKPNALSNLRIALFCGEALPTSLAINFAQCAPNALLDNLYGPTEATISFTQYRFIGEGGIAKCGIKAQDFDIVPLGLPFCDLFVSLRDENGAEVERGQVGEMWLGGDQVALGYYNDTQKTNEKFITEKGVRWYQSGDLGKFDENLGAYCFCGRVDEQVKIQGFRVELLEIDNALSAISGTQARSVVIEKNGLNTIYAVFEASKDSIDFKSILESLRTKLPFYMLPSSAVCLEKFPLNSNGKVDRGAIKKQILHSQRDKIDFGQCGKSMLNLIEGLFRIPRSLTGEGNRKTLKILQESLKCELKIVEVPSGERAFDWEIPREWNVKDAYILTPNGEKICDFKANSLHLVGYSVPTNCELSFDELLPHLYTLESQPNAIPYITSYYKERFGFCLSFKQLLELKNQFSGTNKKFKVVVDSTLENGALSYGEIFIKGKSEQEIVFSTYICHPQMVNNELSGIAVAREIANLLSARENLYSIRIVLVPETIGSIYYLSQNLQHLKESCIAGFVLTCIGDSRAYSVLHSPSANNLADRAARHILKSYYGGGVEYSYLERGSDERQYCAPGVDLPFCTLMRSKFGAYPEYHTSLDDLSLVSAQSLGESLEYVFRILRVLELNATYQNTILCEPQLGKRGLYPTLSTKDSINQIKDMRNLLMYCNGKRDLLEIAEICGINLLECEDWLGKFVEFGLLRKCD